MAYFKGNSLKIKIFHTHLVPPKRNIRLSFTIQTCRRRAVGGCPKGFIRFQQLDFGSNV